MLIGSSLNLVIATSGKVQRCSRSLQEGDISRLGSNIASVAAHHVCIAAPSVFCVNRKSLNVVRGGFAVVW